MNAKNFPVLLLPLDEMVQRTHLAHHVRKIHRAPVGFVNEMTQFLPVRSITETQRKEAIWLNG